MFVGGNSAHLVEVARSEKDPRLRLAAIKSLGVMGDNGRSDVLVSIYRSDQDRAVREAILNALFIQQNGKALVDLARNEQDPQMKKQIINKLALVHSKESTDYMLELLK
jgi:HEAT repeat protein